MCSCNAGFDSVYKYWALAMHQVTGTSSNSYGSNVIAQNNMERKEQMPTFCKDDFHTTEESG